MPSALNSPPLSLLDGAALFLDFDGTLVELAETPDAIQVTSNLKLLLNRLRHRLGGRLAIISGRSLADLDRHLPAAGIAFSGSHGLEVKLADGTALPLSVPLGLDDIRAAVRSFAANHKGLIPEEKPAGIALHYRRVPEAKMEAKAFIEALAEEHGLSVQHGSMVAELMANGATKGDAVRAFMSEPAFAGARPLFVGDDLTDEHGFAAAVELGGAGVLVGPERKTAAGYKLPSVAAVAEWLERAA
jgi:trehalose 6-phosphate phosphatase